METLDVTVIEPRLKHPTIFERFDLLESKQGFIIHNDHDPKPLYYQLLAERGQIFDWEYLQEGPQFWEVRITKHEAGRTPETLGALVASDYRKAQVFSKFGLDFCCGGKKTLNDACMAKGIDVTEVQKALKEIETQSTPSGQDYNSWNLGFLADYILNTHHQYVRTSLPFLSQYMDKVAARHGDTHPELLEIAGLFNSIAEELTGHMKKEEMILFPYIKALAQAQEQHQDMERPPFGSIENPIRMMETEHTLVGDYSERISQLSNNYTPPANACSSYTVLFAKLKEFEQDLHQHIHLENNILFPKAVALEKELLK